ncbi:MAG: GAF domain-containing protein [Chloroflexi bacterium]|nr:GAF domain-containing protein [Chloroflexota bacterium]
MNRIFFAFENATHPQRLFPLLVGYRWISLILPLALFLIIGEPTILLAVTIAGFANIIISLRHQQLNGMLKQYPWLLAVDLLLITSIIVISQTWSVAFYLYALNPLLIAAFLFGLRGAIFSTTAFLPLYIFSLTITNLSLSDINWLLAGTAVVGAYLISSIFGFATSVVIKLQQAQTALTQTHRDLEISHGLTVALQKAIDIEAMQEIVLETITTELKFRRTVIGLVDEETAVLTSWLGLVRGGSILNTDGLTHPARLPLTPEGGLVSQAVLEQRICHAKEAPCTSANWLNTHFGMSGCRIFPMILGDRPIGVILVAADSSPEIDQHLPLLESVVGQTAVAIGSLMTRLNRARQTAVHEERIRIAQDLHDTVSQALFGIVFTLDGSLKLLPDQVDEVIPELKRALTSAELVRSEIRRSILDIWPTTLTAERFATDLKKYTNDILHNDKTALIFDIRGDFASLSPLARRSLYRISQEALNNIAYHAHASEARVCVDIENGRSQLVIRDNGVGFLPQTALNREYTHDHFGLQGILKRSQSIGGECHIFSKPGEGTSIVVDIPV